MTGVFPDKSILASALVLGALVSGTAAFAANGASPAGVLVAQAGPVQLAPRRDLSTPIVPKAAEEERPSVSPSLPAIQIENLGRVDADSIGILDESKGGFGPDMWRGTPRAMIERLLPRLPSAMRSPTLRSLARRMLLSAAALPIKDVRTADAKPQKVSLLARRVERLHEMGFVGPAANLIKVAPARLNDIHLHRLRVENMLLAHDVGGACGEAKRDSSRLVDAYWQRVVIFCQLLDGNSEAAALGANLLAESNQVKDPAFFILADRMGGNKSAKVTSLKNPSALHLAMMRAAKLKLPKNVLSASSPAILRAIGVSPNASLDVQLEAAERAARFGAMSPTRLAEVYSGVEFSEKELGKALSLAAEQRTPRGRALLFRSEQKQSVPAAKAAVIQKALELAQADGLYALAVRLYHPVIKEMKVTGELAWFAGTAARALLAIGDAKAAQPWLVQLRQRAHRDEEARQQQDGLWALSLLAGAEDRSRVDRRDEMIAWLAVLKKSDPENVERRAGLALALLEAFGAVPPAEYWQHILGDAAGEQLKLPPVAYRFALRHAAGDGRRGETVMLLLLMIGNDPLLTVDTGTLRDAILALRAIGMPQDAAALGLEAALEAGL